MDGLEGFLLFLFGMLFGTVLVVVVGSNWQSVTTSSDVALISLGNGFANQTCISQGKILSDVQMDDGLPLIVCSDVSRVDGVNYKVVGGD